MIVIGLTGSIGMGKSTTAEMFRAEGVPVWDADAAVHRLYAAGGAAVGPVLARFPDAGDGQGGIDRERLSSVVTTDAAALRDLEAIVHPLVREDQAAFLEEARGRGTPVVLLDIPLLAESGMSQLFDDIVVVTADPSVRRARVLARPGMTGAKLDAILARQAPESERLKLATHVIRTDEGKDAARARVRAILSEIREKHGLPAITEQGSSGA